jgi:DNA-binding FadR family transcriptional regulator
MGVITATPGADRVLALLQRIIADEGLQPGGRLPTERALAEQASVSRSAVRQALAAMEADGQVIRHVGRGTFLAGPRTTAPSARIATSPADIMTARVLFEPELMPQIAAMATESDFEEMRRCLEGCDHAESLDEFEHWDHAFHRSLARATHNSALIAMSELLVNMREETMWGSLKQRSFNPSRGNAYCADHHAITQALEERDPGSARKAMQNHLKRVRHNILGS